MIVNLLIENYALIDRSNIEFNSGFSVITGETGAGKSIMLGALGLVLGNRADVGVLRDKSRKCIVELSCDIERYSLQDIFEEHDLDYDDNCVIRREISPKGKSRAFVNDTPVNLKVLKFITSSLIDIHSQNQTQILMDKNYQLSIVDSYANIDLLKYKNEYSLYRNMKYEYDNLKDKAKQESADADYYQFQFNKLVEADLDGLDLENLEEEQNVLLHSEEIGNALSKSFSMVDGDEMSAISILKEVNTSLSKVSAYSKDVEENSSRLNSVIIELQDIANEFEILSNNIEFDPSRLEFINSRIDSIYSLFQKHSVGSVLELIELRDSLDEKLNNISNYDEQLELLLSNIDKKEKELLEIAKNISMKRKSVFEEMENKLIKMLVELGIKNANFKIELEEIDLSSTGIDDITFLFSANKNNELHSLGKVASGGEMSRLMLSLKYLICASRNLPSIIFDEIDTGVSGNIAEKMALMMKDMSENMQVISITHLPQIAAKGKWHYKVFKIDEADSTFSKIEMLKDNERVNEIAQMLSGSEVSDAAYSNAKQLLKIT
ncbi:MAG: DNA repair protein RecN [Marinifilaceae bacterium]|jgi:DNA repair protein RecN (Recombination protein N)|nr:DNA repair protein RecN [Marinifilaceae bacterium]